MDNLLWLLPEKMVNYFTKTWNRPETRLQTWFTIAERHFSDHWAYFIPSDMEWCLPREIRLAYSYRWQPIDEIISIHHKKGRLIIEGHFSYYVREDLAIQSRCFPIDKTLLLSLVEDEKLKTAFVTGEYINFVEYLTWYFCLGHRAFFERYFQKFWGKIGISNKEYEGTKDGKGKLDLDEYQDKVRSKKYKNTIERILLTKYEEPFLNYLKIADSDHYDKIQPNMVFGGVDKIEEFYHDKSLLDRRIIPIKAID